MYKIVGILHTGTHGKEGTSRTDGRYPERIGRYVSEQSVRNIEIGDSAFLEYLNSDGSPERGILRTSYVQKIEKTSDGYEIRVVTRNSVFVLHRINNPIGSGE